MSLDVLRSLELPEEVKSLLLEFCLTFLLEQPENLLEFACEYFWRLKESSRTRICDDPHAKDFGEYRLMCCQDIIKTRRKSVFGETYKLECLLEEDQKIVFPKTDVQRYHLLEALNKLFFLRSLRSDLLMIVVDAMFEIIVKEGEIVISQGEESDNFYVVQKGVFEAVEEDLNNVEKVDMIYNHEGSFGELALLYNAPRQLTIRARTDGILWGLDRDTFKRIVLADLEARRLKYSTILKQCEIFEQLTKYERMAVIDALQYMEYKPDEKIFAESDEADGMYFIEYGTVVFTKLNDDRNEVEIESKCAEEFFGEAAMISNRPRNFSAYSATLVKLTFLEVVAFERLVGPCKNIMMRDKEHYQEIMRRLFKGTIADY